MKRSWLRSLFLVVIIAVGCSVNKGNATGNLENIALGKRCQFSPAAVYHLTQITGDAQKLTDGQYAKGNFWSDRRTTVGWQNSGVIQIEIDLERDADIDSVTISTARGNHAGVSYPDRADLFISRDGVNYGYLGNIIAGQDNNDGSYQLRTFRSNKLNSFGRKLMIVVRPRGNFTFIDEIEVRGSHRQAANLRLAGPVMTKAAIKAFLDERYAVARDVKSLALLARESQRASSGNVKVDNEAASLLRRLELQEIEPSRSGLTAISDEIFARQQAVVSHQSVDSFQIWHPNPWAIFSPLTLPAAHETVPTKGLTMELPVDGTFSDSIGIVTTKGLQQSVTVSVEMRQIIGKRAPSIAIREVMPVIRSDFRTIGDPVQDLQDQSLWIKRGESRQIWFTVRADDVEPGEYHGKIRLSASTFRQDIPIIITVWPVRIPRQTHVAVNTWSYLNWRPIRTIPQLAVADLAEHRVNVIVVHPDQIPWPNKSYLELDKVLRLHPFASEYLFYMAFNDSGRRSLGISEPFMSPRWQLKFRQWIQHWAAHMKQKGISPESYAFYPVDEPKNEKDAEVLYQTARLIKEIDPALRVYTTYGDFGRFSDSTFSRLMTVVDQYQIGIDSIAHPKVKQLLNAGKDVWSYSGGGKNCAPLDYYRLQAWRAFKHGITGIGFWAYADTGSTGTAWDDFDGTRPDYSVIYEGKNGIISSKRWEAWREGVEDYELLRLAKAQLRDDQERKYFWRMVDDVITKPHDYSGFQLVRRRLLEIASRQ